MLKRVETQTSLSLADLRVKHENRAIIHIDGHTYMAIGSKVLQRPEWPILRDLAHAISLAEQAGKFECAQKLAEGVAAITASNGELAAMYELANLHASTSRDR